MPTTRKTSAAKKPAAKTRKPKAKATQRKAPAARAKPAKKAARVTAPVEEIVLSHETDTGGRPTLYKPEYDDIARIMCRLGASDYELAEEFGVNTTTIWRWQSRHEGFCNALKEGKDSWDDKVERGLAQKAAGYTFTSEKVFCFQGEVVRAKTVEHVPPDPGAAKLWLTNRRPDAWREKTVSEHVGKDGGPIEVENVGEMEMARRVAFALGRALTKKQESQQIEDAQVINET